MIDIASIVAGIISLGAALITQLIYDYSLRKKRAARREVPPGERIQQSISKLGSASQEIDAIIRDIVQDIKSRQTILEELKVRHQTLSQEEAELSKRVEMLKELPLEVAKYFQQISEQALQQVEKKKARRDILMFILGILVTTVIAILLSVFGVR
ncbi:hypothetical protein LM599_01775 [Candidatus Acetothermia bacterium]|jgi:hypothetical protein|nr:hypothetical protein [Candidatus Acetothermia bacterium]MCI2428388.1 hypothetical protein [Candidatus Acetothermia bacterium]